MVLFFINSFLSFVRTIPTKYSCTGLLLKSCHHFSLIEYKLMLYLCPLMSVTYLVLVHKWRQEMAEVLCLLLPAFLFCFFFQFSCKLIRNMQIRVWNLLLWRLTSSRMWGCVKLLNFQGMYLLQLQSTIFIRWEWG